jgi:hypothetical protein
MTDQAPGPPLEGGPAPHPDDGLSAALRGFGPAGIVTTLVILLAGNVTVGWLVLPAGAALVMAWARLSRTPWHELGLGRPRSWPATVILGLAFGCAFKFLMKAAVMPLLGADPVNHAYHYLAGNQAAIPATLFSLIVSAGMGEEILFRGFLFERLGRLLGTGVGAKAAIVLITSAWFGLGHWANQGLPGVEQAAVVGLVYGTIRAVTGRLWVLMCAHAAFDLTAYAMIYWGLETRVAHLIFK